MSNQPTLALVPTPSGRLLRHKRNKRYGSGVAIWHIKASRRSIKAGRTRYFLSFPEMVFRFEYREKYEVNGSKDNLLVRKVSCGFLNSEAPRGQTKIYSPALTNISSDLRVCSSGIPIHAKTVEELCRKAVADFWNSTYNNEMLDTIFEYEDHEADHDEKMTLKNFKRWSKRTSEEPDWKPGPKDMVFWGTFSGFAKMTADADYDDCEEDYEDEDY